MIKQKKKSLLKFSLPLLTSFQPSGGPLNALSVVAWIETLQQ
jgi:hypothetical protein